MDTQMKIATISDEVYDDVIIYKLFGKPTLLESLKQVENVEVFTAIEEFYTNELKACKFFYLSQYLLGNFRI